MHGSETPRFYARCAASFHPWLCCALVVVACSNEPAAKPGALAGGTGGGPGVSAAGTGGQVGLPSAAAGRGASGTGAAIGGAGGARVPSPGPSDAGADDAGAEKPDARSEPDADASGGRSTGPGDWLPGDYPPNLMAETYLEISGVPGQGSNVRQYKVHIPPSYKPSVPAPVVFCIHGLGQTAVLFCTAASGMIAKSDAEGFVVVMPNGYQNSWNAGTCCGAASTEQLDDVALIRAIFSEVGKHVNIDLDRVYATGLSNGGYLSYRLACEAADIFTAIAPGAGALGKNDIGGGTNAASNFTTCEPSRPVSVLHIHGTADPLISYMLQAPTLQHMAMKNGCGSSTRPAIQPASAGDTKCVSHEGCPAGIELTACTVAEGGHCWFGSEDCGTGGGAIGLAIVGANSDTMKNTDAAWGFFERLSR